MRDALKGTGHHRDHHGGQAGPPDDQGCRQQPIRGCGAGQREGQGAGHRQHQAGDDDEAGAHAVGEPAGHGAGDERADALWGEQQTRDQGALALDVLVVEAEEEERAVERQACQEEDAGRGREGGDAQHSDVDERPLMPPRGVDTERRQEDRSERDRHDDGRVRETGRARHLGQSVEDQGQPGGDGEQSHDVEPVALPGGNDRRHRAPCQDDRRQADGDVDVEDPAPAEVGDDEAAHHRAEGGDHHGGKAGDGHHPPQPSGPGRLHQDGDEERHHDPGGGALDHAKHDQAGPCSRRPPTGPSPTTKSTRESDPEALRPQALSCPAGDRHGNRHGQEVAGHGPLGDGDRCVQVATQSGQGHVDDGAIEEGRYPAQHEDPGQPPEGGVEAAVRRGAGDHDILHD